ncbi:precorrin-6A reductase [Longimycelium tulufanense]|uniref:Precorrin-6A reductase n=1 Tax=Longimycelium tulufanense TaxID=907463 RepID=A0A8J3FW03_9PSEU|nr:cobalt-precorrin-6A reductase [Longimycelium tulufanense]GGM72965.1 precorrin-6A reductase [Longimycelium tulufanense]
MTARVLVLGGTGEARRLAAALADRPGLHVVSSLAGRIADPLLPEGEVRVGGFGGPDGLAAWLRREQVDMVVDATHPFAHRMTTSAARATAEIGVPFLVLRRPGWQAGPGDNWHWAESVPAAASLLADLGERVFSTIGRQELAAFADLDAHWFLARCVDQPEPPLPRRLEIILDRGPFTVDGERRLLRQHRIDVLVTKDSGGDMTAAKLVAARQLGLPVVVVCRPPAPDVPVVETVEEAVAWLETLVATRPHAG